MQGMSSGQINLQQNERLVGGKLAEDFRHKISSARASRPDRRPAHQQADRLRGHGHTTTAKEGNAMTTLAHVHLLPIHLD